MTRAQLIRLAVAGVVSMGSATRAAAQQGVELDKIQLGVVLSERTAAAMGAEATALRRVFETALANKGMGTALPEIPTRFVAYVDMVPLQEEMVPGGMTVVKEQVTVTFGDRAGGRAIGSFQVDAKAVGKSKEGALRNLSTSLNLGRNAEWQSSLEAVNAGIITYFEQQCPALLREADAKVRQQQWDEAIYMTTTVPREASKCHQQSMAFAASAYTAKLKAQCAQPFAVARAKWAASRSRANAMDVADILGAIPADSPCFKEASQLVDQVAAVIGQYDAAAAQERRERIAFARKQYEDRLGLTKDQMKNESALMAFTIDAARQVGVAQAQAYAKAGPPKVTQTLIFR